MAVPHSDVKRRRRKLWKRDPRCRQCGKHTRLPKDIPGWRDGNPDGPAPDMATLEHLDSRYKEYRGWSEDMPDVERTTLTCQECNQRRDREETKRVPNEELRRRSSHDR